MLSVNENDIDRITEIFYLILKGRKPMPVSLPGDYPDNEIKQLVTYVNKFLKEYDNSTDLIYALSKGDLNFEVPRGKILFLHSLKSLQANLRHLTWKTQQIAKGDFSHEIDFMGDFSAAFNSMIRQLKESFQKVEAATRAKSEFLANMSHEIRTPMNSILGFLELSLEDSNLPGVHKNNISTAYNSAKSLLTLINDILDVSKLESGRLELEKQTFNLQEIMDDTLQMFEMKCREKGLTLSCQIHPELSLYFKGDCLRLRQILINLLGNALKFTAAGGIIVTAEPLVEPKDNTIVPGMIHFAVSDTGIGIPLERIDSIFEPFTQAESSTSRRFGGTGLGTTISKQLVELMGGRIWAESQVGKGSIFHFTVKMETAEQDELRMDNEKLKMDNHQQMSSNNLKVLIAEDLKENRMLVRIRLKKAGHIVIEAENGLEAVAAYEKEKPDLILMDIHMPEMNGIDAAQKIREQEIGSGRHIPIIALTASVMKEEQDQCLDAGMDAVAAKPIDFNQLYQLMENLVNRNNSSEEIRITPVFPIDNGSQVNDGIIDINKGLQLWQNEKAYHKALLQFCRKYNNAGDEIMYLLENGDKKGAFAAAHALKGVSGNLCINNVFRIAVKLNAEILTKENHEIIPLVQNLSNDLQKTIEFIYQYIPPQPQEQPLQASENNLSEQDICSLKIIFTEMLALFEEYNPSLLEPFLEKLADSIGSLPVEPVLNKLDKFDFDAAKTEVIRLAASLNIEVENIYS
ncbi:Two component system response regulator/histidine kinase [Desulfonema limicola]|uniref:histidine kinase n=1 Tax=Desulfonema limicola TaxID=45656 RepID=A0A975GFL1_9BACT|nr:ATP-binding protein [Desulfonema limicola]QTA79305.1 Two component system response regulator/histidine kinase [Desulfonema limicola]